jgi:cytoskeleton protein RodZ
MMSPIYVRGFLSTYARTLGLSPDSVLAELDPPPPEPAEELPPPAPPVRRLRLHLPRPVLRGMGAVAAVGLAVVGVVFVMRQLPRLSLPGRSRQTLATVSPMRDAVRPAELPALALSPSEPLELAITTYRATWVQVRADGKLLAQRRLQRGASEQWQAQTQFQLVVANPSQVDLTLNGHSISPFVVAHRGRLRITHRGIAELADEE